MASTLRAENLKMYEPWPHIVNSLDGLERMPDLIEMVCAQFTKDAMLGTVPFYITDRGVARKFQHIVNLNNTVTPVALDPEALKMSEYADAGLMWHAWKEIYGGMVLDQHFRELRLDAFTKYLADPDRGEHYGLKMSYWKDTMNGNRAQSWFSLPRKHTLLRFMMYVHHPKHIVGLSELGIWSNEQTRAHTYVLTPGFGITYNPDNEKHLMDINLSLNSNIAQQYGRRQDFQASWIMYEIIKNDIED